MASKTQPKPDEWGRVRVLDEDTGHRLTIPADQVHLGSFRVLNEDASTAGGDPLPPEHADGGSGPVEPTTQTGRPADDSKE